MSDIDLTFTTPDDGSTTDAGIASVRKGEGLIPPRLLPSPGFAAWLANSGGTLGFTTYQTSRLFLLSAPEGQLRALERIVGSAMGLILREGAIWVANKEQLWRFSHVGPFKGQLKKGDPRQEAPWVEYKALYMPRLGHFLGPVDTHDLLEWAVYRGKQYELLFVNTNFDCIATIDRHYGFVPVWKPSWVDVMGGGDKSHLNGMCARDGKLAYATACARSDSPMGWRWQQKDGGVVIDIQADAVVGEGFSMPHSPRWHDGRLWLLDSGHGDFGYLDPASGRFEKVALCPGFARGLCFVGNHAVIGLSKLRPSSFSTNMPLKQRLEALNVPETCGLLVVNLATGRTDHWLTIENTVTELYDVAFMPGRDDIYTPGFSEPELHRALHHRPLDAEGGNGIPDPL